MLRRVLDGLGWKKSIKCYACVWLCSELQLRPSQTALALLCAWDCVDKINPVLMRRLRVPQLWVQIAYTEVKLIWALLLLVQPEEGTVLSHQAAPRGGSRNWTSGCLQYAWITYVFFIFVLITVPVKCAEKFKHIGNVSPLKQLRIYTVTLKT